MVKITLKSFEELFVDDTRGKAIYDYWQEKKSDDSMPLSAWSLTIESKGNLWIGNLSHIGQVWIEDAVKDRKNNFKSEDSLKEFHMKHGYGGKSSKFVPGFGLLDVQTQYLIDTSQAKIEDNRLIRTPIDPKKEEKWSDLWAVYLTKIDEFHELK